jgi:diguanylate cyclase (GGDEF)-like protein
MTNCVHQNNKILQLVEQFPDLCHNQTMQIQSISPSELDLLLKAYQAFEKITPSPCTTPFLYLLEPTEKERMLQFFTERVGMPGEIVVQENTAGDAIHLICSGRMAVVKGDFQAPIILGFRGAGDIIGEMALLENGPRSASVVALTPIRLLSLSSDKFNQFLNENPAMGLNIMRVLSSRLRQAGEERSQQKTSDKDLSHQVVELREQAIRDPLTGIFNRRYLQEILEKEFARARRENLTISILIMDIDHFKQINDTFGHRAGDYILQEFGKLLQECVRLEDIVCRYGGDEFVVVMPGANLTAACERAEQIRITFHAWCISFEGHELHNTLSLGAAAYPNHGTSAEEVLSSADQALYLAKQNGRNQIATPQ